VSSPVLGRVDWTYPWRSKPLAEGTRCASNVGVASYFSTVYAWERTDWDCWWREVKKRRNSAITITNFLRYGLPLGDPVERQFTNTA
jgi:hypothetical protein